MDLPCTFDVIYWVHPSSELYTCIINPAVISNPNTFIKSVSGDHQPGKSNSDVKAIFVYCETLEYFPKGLEKIFPNLERLELRNCALKEITREDLVGYESLVGLYLYGNNIESLPDDLFVDMKKLQSIWFDYNKISCASSKLLQPIENQLKVARFGRNPKIDADFDKLTPYRLSQLKQLLDKCDKPRNSAVFKFDIQEFLDSFGTWFGGKYEMLWKTEKYSDFTIVADEKEFQVHKNILGSQSSVFKSMFEHDTEENRTGKLKIEIFKAEPVHDFLNYFYTVTAPSSDNALEVFKLAVLYDMPKLKDLCKEIIMENINESNVVKVVELANVHGLDEMKNSAIDFVESIQPGKNFKASVFDDCALLEKIVEANNIIDLFCEK